MKSESSIEVPIQLEIIRGDGVDERTVLVPGALATTLSETIVIDVNVHPLGSIVVRFRIPCGRSWHLSHRRELVACTSRSNQPPFPVGCFLLVRTHQDRLWQIDYRHISQLTVKQTKSALVGEFIVQMTGSCGLLSHGIDKFRPSAQSVTIAMDIHPLESRKECLWLEPYPEGAPAAVCLTDHPDFDTVANTTPLVDLFIDHQVRLTKGVFPVSAEYDGVTVGGMDDSAYRSQMERLHETGSELALHSFGPLKECPPVDECRRRCERLERYQSTTWIDHSIGKYLLTREARLPDGTDLVSFLNDFGVRNFWAYHDVWYNPFGKLNIFEPRYWHDYSSDLVRGLSRVDGSMRSRRRFGYQVAHVLKNIVGNHGYVELVQRPGQLKTWSDLYRQSSQTRALRKNALCIYDFRGCGWSCGVSENWLFDTMMLSHLAVQLREDALELLVDSSGLLLGHTYLTVTRGYIGSNAISTEYGRPVVTEGFRRGVECLGNLQSQRKLVTLSFAELRSVLERFSSARLKKDRNGWQVENLGDGPVWIGGPAVIDNQTAEGAYKTAFGQTCREIGANQTADIRISGCG